MDQLSGSATPETDAMPTSSSVSSNQTRHSISGGSGGSSATTTTSSDNLGLWQRILNEHAPGRDTIRKDVHVLVLGSRNSGARSVVARLAGKDPADLVKGYALEYEFVPIRSKEEEDIDETVGTMHLWHFECPEFADHLPLPITNENAPNTILLLVADLANPHSLMTNLEKWEGHLADFLLSRLYPANPALKASLQQKVLGDLAARQAADRQKERMAGKAAPSVPLEGDAAKDGGTDSKTSSLSSITVGVAKPEEAVLSPGMLLINWGIPIIVVGTKADQLDAVLTKHCTTVLGSSSSSIKHHKTCLTNFVQMHLRKWCLANGAALIYTSAHSNVNCEALLNYITHRSHGFPATIEKSLSKPEAVVIPFGSDSMAELTKLQVDAVAPNGVDTSYASVFKHTTQRLDPQSVGRTSAAAAAASGPIIPIDHQSFLQKQLELLQRKHRDGDLYKSIALPTMKPASATSAAPLPSKDAGAAKPGKKVEQDAEKFFNTMLKNYKK